MATPVDEPISWNRKIIQGTDHDWPVRRMIDDNPVIPTSARAQIRERIGGELWLDLSSSVLAGARIWIDSATGWIHVLIPKSVTEAEEWNGRNSGVWDMEVVVDGSTYRWINESKVSVSPDVTRDVLP